VQFLKAGYAFVLAGLGSIATVLVGDTTFGDVTDGQWVTAAVVAIAAAGGVYGIPYVPSGAGK
jgi:hypothetical protein